MSGIRLVLADGTLIGEVGTRQVHLLLGAPQSRAGIRGSCLGAQVGGYWRIESNSDTLDPVGLFLGEYDGEPVHLQTRAAPVEAPADRPLAPRSTAQLIAVLPLTEQGLNRRRRPSARGLRTCRS